MWPLLSGEVTKSPRVETPLAVEGHPAPHNAFGNWSAFNQSALISGEFKLIVGLNIISNFWQGPDFPNISYVALKIFRACRSLSDEYPPEVTLGSCQETFVAFDVG